MAGIGAVQHLRLVKPIAREPREPPVRGYYAPRTDGKLDRTERQKRITRAKRRARKLARGESVPEFVARFPEREAYVEALTAYYRGGGKGSIADRRQVRREVLPGELVDRARLFARRYREGATLNEIGQESAITRERVRQVLVRAGYRMSELKVESARARRKLEVEENTDRVVPMLAAGELRPQEVASTLGISSEVVRRIDKEHPEFARKRKAIRRRERAPKYSDLEVLSVLRAANEGLGGIITVQEFTHFARGHKLDDGRPWPTHQTALLRFGSWREALEAAGLPHNQSSPISGMRLFERTHCIDAILEAERALGHLPTVREYDEYARLMGGALPSVATIRHRFGLWPDALRAASEFVSSHFRS